MVKKRAYISEYRDKTHHFIHKLHRKRENKQILIEKADVYILSKKGHIGDIAPKMKRQLYKSTRTLYIVPALHL